jgi:hypothetical protein
MVCPFSYGHIPFALIGLSAALVAADPVSAESDLYNEKRVILHSANTANECIGVSDCQIVKSPKRVVEHGHWLRVSVHCPPGKPHTWGWDTEQNEHIKAYLAVDTDRELTIAVENAGDDVGFITIFLGCSAQPYRGHSFMESRVGLPSKFFKSGPQGK